MNKAKAEFWKDFLTGVVFIVIMAAIFVFFYKDMHSLPKPQSAHKSYFPIDAPAGIDFNVLADADLQSYYETYRHMYFGKDMPDARVIWADLPSDFMGRTEKTPDGVFIIRIDRKSNPAPKEALMTELHEMCHVDMWKKEFDEHGRLWQYDMHRLADEGAFEDLW